MTTSAENRVRDLGRDPQAVEGAVGQVVIKAVHAQAHADDLGHHVAHVNQVKDQVFAVKAVRAEVMPDHVGDLRRQPPPLEQELADLRVVDAE